MNAIRENRRHDLLRSAAHLFRTKGYARATIRDLARAVELQSGSIFHYFDSKQDILFAVMEDAISLSITRLERAVENADSTRACLGALIRAELSAIHDDETRDGMEVSFYEWHNLSEGAQATLLDLREQYEDIWMAHIREAKDQGLIQIDPFILRRLLTGALAWTVKWYTPDGSMDMDNLAEDALTMALGKTTEEGASACR